MQLRLTKNWLWGLLSRELCSLKRPSCIANLEKGLAVSFQSNVMYTSPWLSNTSPRCFPKRNANVCPQKGLYMSVHSQVFHNSLNCLWAGEWTDCTIPMMGSNSAIKMNELLIPHGWIRKALSREKEARHKIIHTARLHAMNFLNR